MNSIRRTASGAAALRLSLAVLAAAASLAWAGTALADGTVLRALGCGDKFFVSTAQGYSVLTLVAGSAPADGDELVGNVSNIGHPVLYDKTANRQITAIVEDRWLDKPEVERRMLVECRSAAGASYGSGVVSRAEGCGNKIFVDTDQGVAILDRVAGGRIAKGDSVSGNFNRPGRAILYDRQTGIYVTVFVDDYQVSRAAAAARMTAYCRAERR
ncbi:MAG TPA: hypothetical protein VFA12_05755 [Stellaceae bacterium]|nr:hypothetical protein [Stellaceae bacterium]